MGERVGFSYSEFGCLCNGDKERCLTSEIATVQIRVFFQRRNTLQIFSSDIKPLLSITYLPFNRYFRHIIFILLVLLPFIRYCEAQIM